MSIVVAGSVSLAIIYSYISKGREKCPKCNQYSFPAHWNDEEGWEITDCVDCLIRPETCLISIPLKKAKRMHKGDII